MAVYILHVCNIGGKGVMCSKLKGQVCSGLSEDCMHAVYRLVYIGSHDSDSLLGMTLLISGARMLMYWAGSSQTASPWKINKAAGTVFT